jgi:hypothetical protein
VKKNSEYDAFAKLAGKVLSVPHGEIKAKLDAEKQNKAKKKAENKLPARKGVSGQS